jgi:hypothetical protein
MATIYRSNIAAAAYDAPLVPGGLLTRACFTLSVTPALIADDVLIFAKIPAGVVLTGFFLDIGDIGAPTSPADIGDATTRDKFVEDLALVSDLRVSSFDSGSATGAYTANLSVKKGTLPVYYSAESDLRLTVVSITTAIATPKTFSGFIDYQGRRDG